MPAAGALSLEPVVVTERDEPDAVLPADPRADQSAIALGGTDGLVKVHSVAVRIEETAAVIPATRAELGKLAQVADKAAAALVAAESAAARAVKADAEAASAQAAAEAEVVRSSSVVTQALSAEAAAKAAVDAGVARHAAAVEAQKKADADLAAARAAVPAAGGEIPDRRKAVEAADAALATARAADADGAAKRAVADEATARAKDSAGKVTASQQQLAAARADVERRAAVLAGTTNETARAEAQTAFNTARDAMQAAETATGAAQQAEVQANAAAAAAAAAAQSAPPEPMTKQALLAAAEAARVAVEALGMVEARIAAAKAAVGPCETAAQQAAVAATAAASALAEARAQVAPAEASLARARDAAADAARKRDAAAAAKAATASVAAKASADAAAAKATAVGAAAARDAVTARIQALEQGLVTLKAAQLDTLLDAVGSRIEAQGADPGGAARRIEMARAAVGRIRIPKPPPPQKPVKAPNPILQLLGRHHLVVLHFPIALLVVAFLFELIWWVRRVTWAGHGAFLLLHLGSFSAVVTAALGWMLAAVGTYDETMLVPHRWLGTAAAAASVVAVVLRGGRRPPHALYPMVLFATVACVGLAGHFGGSVTHGEGFLTEPLPRAIAAFTGREPAAPDPTDLFTTTVRPILEKHCLSCHGGEHPAGGYALDRKAGAFQGVTAGTAGIVPGDPSQSELARRILMPPGHPDAMPPAGHPAMPPADALAIVHWIQQGAPWAESN
jgi:uncharacterized membrane protein